eukprot:9628368-Alexandrium_andersonii.AAC.1
MQMGGPAWALARAFSFLGWKSATAPHACAMGFQASTRMRVSMTSADARRPRPSIHLFLRPQAS